MLALSLFVGEYCLMFSSVAWYEKREIGRLPLRAWRLHSCKAKRRNEAASLRACVRVDDPVFLCIRGAWNVEGKCVSFLLSRSSGA